MIKPASETPLSALALAELAERAGIPKGVLNVVTGAGSAVGGELTANPTVRKLSFTGSTEIGKVLMAQCAATVKKTSMELGGNAPFIVFEDADLDQAVQGAMMSKYRNTGQTCVCANRILVQDGVYDEFSSRLTQAVSGLIVGRWAQGRDPSGTADQPGRRGQGGRTTSPTPLPRAPASSSAASATRWAAPSSSPPCSPT